MLPSVFRPWTVLFVAGLALVLPARPDRRVVDTVIAGNAESELAHGYAGHRDSAWVHHEITNRMAHGWIRYAMTTFDDTEVTLAAVFEGSRGEARHLDVVVEDSVVARASLAPTDSATRTLEWRVPFGLTKGRTSIAVMLRGRNGPTPVLRSLSVLQDHYEWTLSHNEPVALPTARPTLTNHSSGAVR